jgi:predicted dehydrogenase
MIDSIVLALPPIYQSALVKELINFKNIKNLLLEKPLAISPDNSAKLTDELVFSNKKFRVGYNFRFTYWGVCISKFLKDSNQKNKFNRN